jgi:hypothetical protein
MTIDMHDYTVTTWFERDRGNVCLYYTPTDDARNDPANLGVEILDVWDDHLSEMVVDGFLDGRDWKRSSLDYAEHIGLNLTPETETNP